MAKPHAENLGQTSLYYGSCAGGSCQCCLLFCYYGALKDLYYEVIFLNDVALHVRILRVKALDVLLVTHLRARESTGLVHMGK